MGDIRNSISDIQIAQDKATGGQKTQDLKDKLLIDLMKETINKTMHNAYKEQPESTVLFKAKQDVIKA